jgi:hypothetical protein
MSSSLAEPPAAASLGTHPLSRHGGAMGAGAYLVAFGMHHLLAPRLKPVKLE